MAGVLGLAACLINLAHASVTDLAAVPLQTLTQQVKPNLLFILDDSGSMSWDYMPDWASGGGDSLVRNSVYNGVYYNPAITYSPPMKADGSSYKSMTAGNTSNWSAVPYDGFNVQTAAGASNNLFTNGSSGTTQNLVGKAYYYIFVPAEFCKEPALKTCNAQAAPSTSYPYPALLKWCSDTALTDCRATRIESASNFGKSYTNPRYPGASAGAFRPNVPGQNSRVNIQSTTSTYLKSPSRTDCVAQASCTYSEEMSNFANWWAYYRTRMQMAKSAVSIAFAIVDTNFRLGFMSINNNTSKDFLNVQDITYGNNGQKAQWYTKLFAATPNNSTPLRLALSTAGRYYAGKTSTVNGIKATDPMQYACQRNYTMLSTDGYWNENGTPTNIDGAAIGNQDDGSTARPYLDGTGTSNTLADVAQYFYSTDLRDKSHNNTQGVLGSDVASNTYGTGQQRMYTSTVGLGASGYAQYQADYASATTGDYYNILKGVTASNSVCGWQSSGACNWPKPASNTQTTIDDLWHAAVNGRGKYYSAGNPVDLKAGLQEFILNAAQSDTSEISAPTVSNVNLKEDDNFIFRSSYKSGEWYGEVTMGTLDVATAAESTGVVWSESDPKAGMATNSKTVPKMLSVNPSTRKVYTYDASAGNLSTIEFKWPFANTTIQGYFKVAAISALSQFCTTGPNCLPSAARVDSNTAGKGTGVGGINLVNFLRGDTTNEGADGSTHYRFRNGHMLGDIANAQPVYVKAPNYHYSDSGYNDFLKNKALRQAMLYVGANDGMLHAFKATDGSEAWAYIPSFLLPNLYKLADKNYAQLHNFYVDATPRAADVSFNGVWHTILVGGLGQGGRGIYALDVSNADMQPKVLWEFSDPDLGYTFGKPAITKLSDGTWVVLVSSGYNNVSPGSGRGLLWVLNASNGAIIKKIDTGVGGTTALPPACTGAPCPSGLAHIKAYSDNADINNTSSRVYGGDLFGNVWRFNMSGLTAAGGTATAELLATLTDATGKRQPITSIPELGNVDGTLMIFVGTGAYLGQSDLSTTGKQSMYAIKDTGATTGLMPRTSTCSDTVKANCFVQNTFEDKTTPGVRKVDLTVKAIKLDLTTMNGWYVDMPELSERIVTEPKLALGTLVFTSIVPSTSDPCLSGGSSWANYVDYRTGLAVEGATEVGRPFTFSGNVKVASALTLVKSGNGDVTGFGNPSPFKIPVNPRGQQTRRVSWRELITN